LALGYDASTYAGTYDTIAPELLKARIKNQKLKYNEEADVYSLGCALYCMLFGEYPFTNKNGKNNTPYEIL
jgi:serine/threonine protein kinase